MRGPGNDDSVSEVSCFEYTYMRAGRRTLHHALPTASMGNDAPVYRSIQNSSIHFQGACPNNSTELPIPLNQQKRTAVHQVPVGVQAPRFPRRPRAQHLWRVDPVPRNHAWPQVRQLLAARARQRLELTCSHRRRLRAGARAHDRQRVREVPGHMRVHWLRRRHGPWCQLLAGCSRRLCCTQVRGARFLQPL